MPVLLKLFPKMEEDETFSNSFYKACITLIPKSDKDTTKRCSQFFTIENDVGCAFVIYGLDYVEVSSLYAYFLEGFYNKWC